MKEKDVIKLEEKSELPSSFDKIQEYWLTGGKTKLTPKQIEINTRWKMAYTLAEEGHLDAEIAKTLSVMHKQSIMQSYRDIKSAKSLFGDVVEIDMKIERYFASQSCKELIREARQKKDLKAWATALKTYITIVGIDSDNIDADLYKKLEQHNVYINLGDADMNILKHITTSGMFDFSKAATQAEVIPWDEVEQA